MKLGDFNLLDDEEQDELADFLARVNNTRTDYPRNKTVQALFSEQAAATPEATAVIFGPETLTYGELERRANQMAHFLLDTGVVQRESYVGVLMERTLDLIPVLLGILKAGAAYLPLSPNWPYERLRYMLADAQAPVLIGQKGYVRTMNKLQWECDVLTAVVCIDSDDFYGEIEQDGGLMDSDMWAYIAQETFDDISGGGWKSSYTGEWLSREVMDEYAQNIRQKLEPYLSKETRVFEVGCASGISMFALAPLVGFYYGTDLSAGIIDWTQKRVVGAGLDNIKLKALAAHEIDQVEEGQFDVVIINSVIELFTGHNYLRDVVQKAIGLLKDEGLLFLGNVWDQDRKNEFIESLVAFQKEHAGEGYYTKVDRSDELYISRRYLQDLQHDLPAMRGIEFSEMLGSAESELSQFGFDALVKVDKRPTVPAPVEARHKFQYGRSDVLAYPQTAVAEQTNACGLAYLIYTSGSTGRPKGVMIEHRSIVRLVCNTNYIEFGADDCVLQTGAISFDASTFEIWGPLLNGGRVCLAPKSDLIDPAVMAQLVHQHAITTIFLTTSFFNQLVDIDLTMFAGVKTLLTGGEKISINHFNRVRQTYPEMRLLHVYGPTENTTYTTFYVAETVHADDVPIGGPIANSTVYVLDTSLQDVPIGTPGELYTGGEGLARGYLNDPDLTARKFVTLPERPDERLYRTGDLVRWRPDGNIDFIGRIDNQVKIRGYRIEPEEVETTVMCHEAVQDAVVMVKTIAEQKQLVAYVTGVVTEKELRDSLKQTLPDYMIPTHIIHLDSMPLNQSGKVDRRALPDPTLFRPGEGYTTAQTETEKGLVAIWEEILERRPIGIHDNFFDAGGHSLKVTKLIARVQEQMGVTLPLNAVFNAPTVAQLAQQILDQLEFGHTIADEPLVLLNGQTDKRPLFIFPPGTGDALGFIQMASLFDEYAFYAFNFIEAESRLADYADLVMQMGSAPYWLLGYSSGGNLAYRVAAELERRGEKVAAVVMLDSSRKLARYEFDPAEVQAIVHEFLAHESVAPTVENPLLREKLIRQIQRSYKYIENSVDEAIIQADIHVIACVDAVDELRDENGRLLASTAAWAEATKGTFTEHQGYGRHNDMLYPPHLGENVALVKRVLAGMRDEGRK